VPKAVSVVLVTVQVSVAGGLILTVGRATFCETVVDAEAVHPFEGSVTVTEYVPVEFTVMVVVFEPPFQTYVTPGVVEEAVSVTLETVQVRLAGGAILTFGGVTVCVTVAEAEAVQLFAGSVTVTLYVPGELTVCEDVVLPFPQL
jgi:hypothetical protein